MKSTKAETDWIVVREGLELHCKRCGESYRPALPIPTDLYVALSDAFVLSHSECELPNPEPDVLLQ